jgi:hypothetical protein
MPRGILRELKWLVILLTLSCRYVVNFGERVDLVHCLRSRHIFQRDRCLIERDLPRMPRRPRFCRRLSTVLSVPSWNVFRSGLCFVHRVSGWHVLGARRQCLHHLRAGHLLFARFELLHELSRGNGIIHLWCDVSGRLPVVLGWVLRHRQVGQLLAVPRRPVHAR